MTACFAFCVHSVSNLCRTEQYYQKIDSKLVTICWKCFQSMTALIWPTTKLIQVTWQRLLVTKNKLIETTYVENLKQYCDRAASRGAIKKSAFGKHLKALNFCALDCNIKIIKSCMNVNPIFFFTIFITCMSDKFCVCYFLKMRLLFMNVLSA